MNSEELKTKYKELYKLMAEGKDPEKMHIFGHAEKHIFRELADRDPATAERWLAMLAPVEWHNYLTEEEAEEVSAHIENQDGAMGYHWPCAVLFPAVEPPLFV